MNERKIEALRNMAKSGTKHEAEAAKRILAMMDIAEQEEEPVAYYAFKYSNSLERKLLVQTCAMVFNSFDTPTYHRRGARCHILVKCTERERIELDLIYESYRRALNEELAITVSAFIQKNNIFPTTTKTTPNDTPLTDRERKILARAAGVDHVSVRKQIAGRAE